MFEQYPEILSVEDACEALRVRYNSMYEILNSGKVKAFKNGRCWRIPKVALVEFILSNSKMSN